MHVHVHDDVPYNVLYVIMCCWFVERVQTEEGDKEDPPVDEEEEELDELMSMTADRPLPAATTPSTTSTTSTGPAVAKDGLLDIPNGHDKGIH